MNEVQFLEYAADRLERVGYLVECELKELLIQRGTFAFYPLLNVVAMLHVYQDRRSGWVFEKLPAYWELV